MLFNKMPLMFSIGASIVFSLATANASEDVWRELPSENPAIIRLQVTTSEGQAASFVDQEKVMLYAERLLADPRYQALAAARYAESGCDADGTNQNDPNTPDDDEWADSPCGSYLSDISDGNTVLWSFGRGGWASAGAEYRTFVTFMEAGTGRFTSVAFAVHSNISVESDTWDGGETNTYNVVITFPRIDVYNFEGEIVQSVDLVPPTPAVALP